MIVYPYILRSKYFVKESSNINVRFEKELNPKQLAQRIVISILEPKRVLPFVGEIVITTKTG